MAAGRQRVESLEPASGINGVIALRVLATVRILALSAISPGRSRFIPRLRSKRSARAIVFILAAGLAAAQDQTFKDAFALYQAGSVEDARKLLLGAARPSALDLTLLGSIEYQEQHFNEAEKYLRRALVLNPALPGAHATLAHVLEAQANLALHDSHDLLRARTLADQAGSFAPDETGILILRARTRNLQGDTEAALALLLNAEKKTPDNPVLLYATGVLCLQMDLFKDAASYLERAAQLNPKNAATLYALASARISTRDCPAAIKIYEDLRHSGHDNAQVSYALGATYFLAGDIASAKTALTRSIDWEPGQVESYYYLALIAEEEGDPARSVELLRTVLARQPAHLRGHVALGMAYKTAGRLADAEEEMRTAVRLDPNSQKAHYQLGLILTALKRNEQAKSELQTAAKLRGGKDDKVSWELEKSSGPGK